MKNFRLASLCALFLLVSVSTAQAVPVTVNGAQYNVTSFIGSFNDNSALLMNQPWWTDPSLAATFSIASFDAGLSENFFGIVTGALFGYGFNNANDEVVGSSTSQQLLSPVPPLIRNSFAGAGDNAAYGVAELVAVPEPASAMLLMLGLAGFVATKRKGNRAAS